MAYPTITFNSGTGSDTAASGSGGTAITAGGNDGAATVATSADVTLSLDAPDLSSIVLDGTWVMWVDSSSGRQFSVITAFNDTTKVVTCADTFSNTETRAWGIGGKRATIGNADSRTLVGSTGAKAGWTVVLEDNQSISTTWTISVAGLTIKGNSESSHRQILQSGNVAVTTPGVSCRWINLKFAHSNATKTSAYAFSVSAGAIQVCSNCIFGDVSNKLNTVIFRASGTVGITADNCEICYLTTSLGITNVNISVFIFEHCWIHDNVSHGVSWTSDATCGPILRECLIEDNAGDGINVTTTTTTDQCIISGCTIDGNTGDGIDLSTASTGANFVIKNNNITTNGGYGINAHSTIDEVIGLANYNNYGTGATANTSGARNNLTAGANDLAVDPGYVDAAGNNFAVGTSLKAKAYPVGATHTIGANQSGTYTYKDVGAAQREESGAAASGGFVIGS